MLRVQDDITELEAKLAQKRTEEKQLQESLEQKLAERDAYQKKREQTENEIRSQIDEAGLHLEHHRKSEESLVKFSQGTTSDYALAFFFPLTNTTRKDVSEILDREVSETLKKTKEVLLELVYHHLPAYLVNFS